MHQFVPLLLIAAGFLLFFATGAHRYLSFEVLSAHRQALQHWVEQHALTAVMLYFLVYVLVVALSLPGGALMTMVAGFLFGTWLGGAIVVLAATLGATLLYLAARTAFADVLRAKTGSMVARMKAGFQDDALSYLLVLRLVPIFPFFVVNLVPAFLGVPAATFVVATFIGIIPGTFVYASVGNGLGAVLETGGRPDFHIIYDPEIFGPLLALAALACVPIVYKRFRRRGTAENGDERQD